MNNTLQTVLTNDKELHTWFTSLLSNGRKNQLSVTIESDKILTIAQRGEVDKVSLQQDTSSLAACLRILQTKYPLQM